MCAFTLLEPDSSVNTPWNITGGAASRHAATSDDNTATGIDNPGTGSTQQFGMQTVVVTGGGGSPTSTQRIRGIRMRDCIWKFDAQAYLRLELWAFGASSGWAPDAFTRSVATGNETYTSAWFSTISPTNASEWSQANLDGLQLRCWESSSVAGRVNVLELNAEVEVNTRPTTTSVTVTGETTTTMPSATWTYTQPDGYGQKRRQAKVFASSVYSAPGFSPDTSTPTWSSDAYTSDASLTIGANLTDGVTYRLYVRTAMSWPLGDKLWWSDWAFDGFTMALSPPVPPPPPAVTRTVDAAGGRTTLDIRPGLNWLSVQDSSLEDSANTGTWVNLANSALVNTAAQASHGTRSLQMTASGAGNMSARTASYGQGIDRVFPGRDYAATARFRTAATARSVRVSIRWLDAAGSLLSTTNGGSVTDSSANFDTTATVTGTAPAGAFRWDVVAEVLSAGAAEVHYVDRIGFAPGTAVTWSPGAAGLTGFDATTLVDYQDTPGPNLLAANTADATNTAGSVMGFSVPTVADRLVINTIDAWIGNRSLLWGPSAAGSILDLGWSTVNTTVNAAPLAAPGTTMRCWVAVRAETGTFDVRVRLRARDGTGSVVGSSVESSTVVVTTSWTIISSGLYTVPDTALWMEPAILNQGGTTTGVLYYGGGMLEITSSTVTPTADDWMPGTGDRPEAWLVSRAVGADGYNPLFQYDQRAVAYDYEARRGDAPRIYRLISQTTYSGVVTASAPTYVAAYEPPGSVWWLKDPNRPELNRPYSATQRGRVILTPFEIPEAVETYEPADASLPVVHRSFLAGRNGQLRFAVRGMAERERLLTLLNSGWALYVQLPWSGPGANRYIRTSGARTVEPVQMESPATSLEIVEVSYVETARPPIN